MKGSILFVCTANVCRSPLMQYTFLGAVPDSADWAVASAGAFAREGARICDVALSSVRSPRLRSQAEAHRSVPVDDALMRADLVIVASRAERAALAQREPGARSRVFTLSEAVLLGRCAATRQHSETDETATISQYAQLLDAQRGMLVIPRPRRQRRLLGTGEHAHPLDIPDGHQRRRGAHVRVLKRVQAEADALASQMVRFSGANER